MLGWVTVSIMTGSYAGALWIMLLILFEFITDTRAPNAAWLFTVVGTVQMLLWAGKKHRAYKKEFGKEYPRGRKAMIPFIY
jgi:hypothetical protein